MKSINPDPSRCIPCLKTPPLVDEQASHPIMDFKPDGDRARYALWLIEVKAHTLREAQEITACEAAEIPL